MVKLQTEVENSYRGYSICQLVFPNPYWWQPQLLQRFLVEFLLLVFCPLQFLNVVLRLKRKYGRPCQSCKAIGYYACKLCKGSAMISWSPLYDSVFINPCVCPTCDGFKVQRCLNFLGYGYA